MGSVYECGNTIYIFPHVSLTVIACGGLCFLAFVIGFELAAWMADRKAAAGE